MVYRIQTLSIINTYVSGSINLFIDYVNSLHFKILSFQGFYYILIGKIYVLHYSSLDKLKNEFRIIVTVEI